MSPIMIWFMVEATPAGTAPGLHESPVLMTVPSAVVAGWPSRSVIAVTGVGSHWVPPEARVEYAEARSSGLVA